MPKARQTAEPFSAEATAASRGRVSGPPFVVLEAPPALPEALHAAQELIEALAVPVFSKDRAGNYLGVNKAWEEFFGIPREEFLGKQVRDLYPLSPEVAEKHRAMDEELWRHPGRQSYEITVVAQGGRLRDTIYYKATLPGPDGEVAGLIGTIVDITERKQAESATRESEARFRNLTEVSSDWYWEQNENFRFSVMSGGIQDSIGVSPGEFIGKQRWDARVTGMTEAGWAAHKAALEARQPFQDLEYGRFDADGRLHYISDSGKPVFDESGIFKGYRGIGKDITVRKRAEQLLTLEHSVTRCLAETDSALGGVEAAIRAVCETEGWECGRYFRPDEKAGVMRFGAAWGVPNEAVERYIAGSRDITYLPGVGLMGRVWQSGQPLWVSDLYKDARVSQPTLARGSGMHGAFVFPIISEAKTIGVLAFNSREVREPEERLLQAIRVIGSQIGQFIQRKQAEEVLRESEERFRGLTEVSADWYWEQDENFRFTSMSHGIEESLGVPAGEFIGKLRWEGRVIGLSETDWAAHKAALEAHQPFQDFEYGRYDAAGRLHYISGSGKPMSDEHGRFKGYRGVGRDITERKTAEATLRRAHDELARSNAELEQFAYVASHDLQEPLRMVSSYTQLLVRRYGGRLDGDAKEFTDYIVDGAARMKQLIEDLLAYSRVGTRGKEFRPVACEAALKKALVNLRAGIEAGGATVTHDPLPTIEADDSQLTQLFQNLVGNSLKFHGNGTPMVHISAAESDEEWVFSVTDNGIGIEPQYFERIFLVFQRLHNKGEYPGTGIGLAICKKVVDRHGGRIWVESKPGEGTTIRFTLPKQRGEKYE